MSGTTVIIGASHGGVQTAASLRDLKYDGRIVLVSDETHLPYHRPPLSKALLEPSHAHALLLRPQSFYDQKSIEMQLRVRVDAIDIANQKVVTGKDTIAFDHLVLATGTRPRTPDLPGAGLRNVLSLRTLSDAGAIVDSLADAQNVVVLGAGMIGLEFAAVVARTGRSVTVIDTAGRALSRAVSPPMADYLAKAHTANGVRLKFNDSVVALEGDDAVQTVVTGSGKRLPADVVLFAIGVSPNVELAQHAGLALSDGICVDACLRTSDPNIFAIGDCASFLTAEGDRLRIESVQTATDHARAVAANIVGSGGAYAKTPWFWSDQYDIKLQIAGLWQGHDQMVRRAGSTPDSFAFYLFRQGRLICVESVNSAIDHVMARKMLTENFPLQPAQAAAADFDPKKAMTAHRAPAGKD